MMNGRELQNFEIHRAASSKFLPGLWSLTNDHASRTRFRGWGYLSRRVLRSASRRQLRWNGNHFT